MVVPKPIRHHQSNLARSVTGWAIRFDHKPGLSRTTTHFAPSSSQDNLQVAGPAASRALQVSFSIYLSGPSARMTFVIVQQPNFSLMLILFSGSVAGDFAQEPGSCSGIPTSAGQRLRPWH